MKRRDFIATSAMALGASWLSHKAHPLSFAAPEVPNAERIFFSTSNKQYQAVYSHALETLHANVTTVANYSQPVLIEGSNYGGIWLECAPQEGLLYAPIRADVARNNHLALFALQRTDGQIPCWIRKTSIGFAQIQMVVPIAATAWELCQQSGDSELLERAYDSCSRWDAWLRRYRNTRQTGLCEGFCPYDTGHDNSPRWANMPNRCPEGEAKNCPPVPSLPRLSPDLSATVYGGRVALAAMAKALGKTSEEDRWLADAEAIRRKIIEKLYVAEDAAFYDLDAQDHFVRVRGDVISRVLGEHVVDQKLFETIYERQIHNPSAFWTPYPLPSIALDDKAFVRPIPENSWGGASQALTALRAPRWMGHYGKPADLAHLMEKWVEAILRADQFLQQMDPLDGKFTPATGNYSPAALAFIDFTWRLSGVRQIGDELEWNIRPFAKNVHTTYKLRVSPARMAEIRYASGRADMAINGKDISSVSGTVRLITDHDGNLKRASGISPNKTTANIRLKSGKVRKIVVNPNQTMTL